ncbi:MAG: hypothetical protein HYY06_22790 [Deltaproteobacteria bacterium]|nr:hypothetical protein [Deltaproteobacteria bacterium]
MEKVFSSRLDEEAIAEMSRVAKRLGMTKKEFLESAIRLRVRELEGETGTDVWEETLGAWDRNESAQTTRRRARAAFERSFRRRHGRTRKGG